MNQRGLTVTFVAQEPDVGVAITHDSELSVLFEKVRWHERVADSRPD